MPELTTQQAKGLDLSRHLVLEAGAGSGKTRVLVERYTRILEAEPETDLRSIVAFTFTEKAAAEMRERIRRSIIQKRLANRDLPAAERTRWEQLRDRFDEARISTIHSFCRTLLVQRAVAARVDPDLEVLDDFLAHNLKTDSALQLLRAIAVAETPQQRTALDELIRRFGSRGLREMMTALLDHRALVSRIYEKFCDWSPAQIALYWRSSLPEPPVKEEDDVKGAQLMLHLLTLWPELADRYEEAKGRGRRLDFDDLELRAAALLQTSGQVREACQQEIRYLLVDELQDINGVQWEIISRLVGPNARLFGVGDPKQSIYAFRGAEVETFGQVRQAGVIDANRSTKLHQKPFSDSVDSTTDERAGSIQMNENFRSLPTVIQLSNVWFEGLMGQPGSASGWEVAHAPLFCRRGQEEEQGSVEVLLVPPGASGNLDDKRAEAEGVARWIRRITEPDSRHRKRVLDPSTGQWTWAETCHVGLLLRARTRLSVYEDALRSNGIQFHVLGGVGFYQRQEVLDLWCLLRTLVDPDDDIALAAVLRSPLFSTSDDALYRLVQQTDGRTVWSRLRQLTNNDEAKQHRDTLSSTDRRALEHASNTIAAWRRRADRVRTSELLSRALEETGSWGVYAAGEGGPQTVANVAKLIEVVRGFEHGRPTLLLDVVEELSTRIDEAPREGQAAVGLEAAGVRVMTVHAAKGLEFPVVCLVDAERNFNVGGTDRLLMDPDLGFGFTISITGKKGGLQNAATSGRQRMANNARARAIAEEKRLLYVACTRARDHLLISAVDRPASSGRGSFRDWLLNDNHPVPGLSVDLSPSSLRITSNAGTVDLPLFTDPLTLYPGGAQVTASAQSLHTARDLLDHPPEDKPPLPEPVVKCLNRKPAALSIDRHSTTQLNTYRECPKKFEYQYVYGIPEWTLFHRGASDEAEKMRASSRHAVMLGRLCHRLFESLPHLGERALDQLITRFCREEQAPEKEYRQDLERIVENARGTELWSRIFGTPGDSETPFSLDLGECVVEGVIDHTQEKDGVEVFDYKSAKVKRGKKIDKRKVASVVHQHEMQMQVYAMGMAEARGLPVEDITAILFLTDLPDDPRPINVRQGAQSVNETLTRLAESLRTSHFPPNDPSRSRCTECGYWQHWICTERKQKEDGTA